MSEAIMQVIRPFTPADTERFADFLADLSPRSRYFFWPHGYDHATAAELTQPEKLADRSTLRFLAEEEGVMTGYVFLWDWDTPLPWLGIAVRDGYQRRGVGQQMMETMLALAKRHGKRGLKLTTMKDNERAQRLYARCGFTIVGIEQNGEYLLVHRF